jgi:DNA (cytosine-5)-methyltransferase 1
VNEPTHLDLFSGIGGFALAAKWAGFRTIAFCEIDKYCQKILAKNFGAKDVAYTERERNGDERSGSTIAAPKGMQGAPRKQRIRPDFGECDGPRIIPNIFDFDGTAYRGCGLLTGGFPCQPFSVAGKRRGAADDRHVWPQMLRVISEAKPSWVLGENVVGIDGLELDNCISGLEAIGYEVAPPLEIPACAVDAKHRRMRVWIIANANGSPNQAKRRSVSETDEVSGINRETLHTWMPCRTGQDVADSNSQRLPQRSESQLLGECQAAKRNGSNNAHANRESPRRAAIERSKHCQWLAEPDVGRVAHGIPARVDRLKGLGNAIVPQVAYEILKEIRKLI